MGHRRFAFFGRSLFIGGIGGFIPRKRGAAAKELNKIGNTAHALGVVCLAFCLPCRCELHRRLGLRASGSRRDRRGRGCLVDRRRFAFFGRSLFIGGIGGFIPRKRGAAAKELNKIGNTAHALGVVCLAFCLPCRCELQQRLGLRASGSQREQRGRGCQVEHRRFAILFFRTERLALQQCDCVSAPIGENYPARGTVSKRKRPTS